MGKEESTFNPEVAADLLARVQSFVPVSEQDAAFEDEAFYVAYLREYGNLLREIDQHSAFRSEFFEVPLSFQQASLLTAFTLPKLWEEFKRLATIKRIGDDPTQVSFVAALRNEVYRRIDLPPV